MRRAAILFLLLSLLLCSAVSALDSEESLQRQADSMGLEELKREGETYTGETDLENMDVGSIFSHILKRGKDAMGQTLREAMKSCVILLAIVLLCSLAEGIKPEEDALGIASVVAAFAITTVALGDVHSLLGQGQEAIEQMQSLGDLLLPAVSMATAASGAPATAAVRHGVTILFSDVLLRLINHLLIPLCFAFVAANVAWGAVGNVGLKRVAGLIKWIIATTLSIVLLAFITYLNFSGVISGTTDAATVKTAKFTISNLVPVVGGIISDTAETLLTGASVLRRGAGIFGMLAVMGICVVPFLNLGLHYLMYKVTAALAATVSGDGRVTGLIDALGAAFGLILAMTASCATLLIIAMISSVSAVAI